MRLRMIAAAGGAVASLVAAGSGFAQSWPGKPIRLIVTAGPGGGTDILGRTIAQKLGEALGQQVIVDNRGGAGGNIGAELAARSPADGHTILIVNTSYGINPSLRTMPFDPLRDLAPVSRLTRSPLLLVAHPSLPVRSVADLVRFAKPRPGELSFASSGSGQSNHLAGELFNAMAGVRMLHIPYKGGGLVLTDLLGGHVTLFFGGIISTLPHVKAGRLRALGVTSLGRAAAIPDVPSISEAALAGFEAVGWYGILVPAATPRAIIVRLHAEITGVLASPEMQARIVNDGSEPVGSTPEQFADFIRAEIVKWGEVVRKSGAKLD
jgi:tripartite-type tricarboxylate transporter receptor subunit TctC